MLVGTLAYTIHFNMMNFPAGVLPVIKVTEEDVHKLMNEGPTNDDLYAFARN